MSSGQSSNHGRRVGVNEVGRKGRATAGKEIESRQRDDDVLVVNRRAPAHYGCVAHSGKHMPSPESGTPVKSTPLLAVSTAVLYAGV